MQVKENGKMERAVSYQRASYGEKDFMSVREIPIKAMRGKHS